MLHYKVSVFLELHSSHSIGSISPGSHDVLFVVALENEQEQYKTNNESSYGNSDDNKYRLVVALLNSCAALECRLTEWLRLTELLRLVELRLLWLTELLRLVELRLLWLIELRLLRLIELRLLWLLRLLEPTHSTAVGSECSTALAAKCCVVIEHSSASCTSFHYSHPFL